MSIDAPEEFRASRASFISFPAFSRSTSRPFPLSLIRSLFRKLDWESQSRNGGREHRGVVAVMNASWGNGVPLIVQRVVPPLRPSHSFFCMFCCSFCGFASLLSLQRRRRVRTEFKMHGYASFILNYELERLWPGESSVTAKEEERRTGGEKKQRFAAPSSNSSRNSEKVDESETFDISDTDCMLGWLNSGAFLSRFFRERLLRPPTNLRH